MVYWQPEDKRTLAPPMLVSPVIKNLHICSALHIRFIKALCTLSPLALMTITLKNKLDRYTYTLIPTLQKKKMRLRS